MRRAVGANGRNPILSRFFKLLPSPAPGQRSLQSFRHAIARDIRAADFGFCFRRFRSRTFSRHVRKHESQRASGPLIDAIESGVQIVKRVGYAEAQVAFSEIAEGG